MYEAYIEAKKVLKLNENFKWFWLDCGSSNSSLPWWKFSFCIAY